MFRVKRTIALASVAIAVGLASLATPASADNRVNAVPAVLKSDGASNATVELARWGRGGGWGRGGYGYGFGRGYYAPRYYGGFGYGYPRPYGAYFAPRYNGGFGYGYGGGYGYGNCW